MITAIRTLTIIITPMVMTTTTVATTTTTTLRATGTRHTRLAPIAASSTSCPREHWTRTRVRTQTTFNGASRTAT